MNSIPLNKNTLTNLPASIIRPEYTRPDIKSGIIHIGVGGFHRSHQALYLQKLLNKEKTSNWGICGIGLREGDRLMNEVFQKQDCLYTLITQHPNGNIDCEVIGSITEFILAIDHPGAAINKMMHADTKIVSLTITEGGYNFNPSTGEFDFSNQDVQHDLQHPDKPKTVFGFLCAALRLRKANDIAPFTILSCDNIQHNGDVARKMILAFAKKQESELSEWIKTEVTFPNTMVDRITPVTTEPNIQYLKEEYQVHDQWPVICEPFTQWIIEDNFCNSRPELEAVGVQFVPDVTPYEKMKIRLLNAGHSVLGIPGEIHGHETIDECMHDKVFSTFMRNFMDIEVTPLLGTIEGINLTDYKNSLEERFGNPNLKDGVDRICAESSAKLPKFIVPTIIENLENGGSITYATFILAAWCYYSDKQMDDNGRAIKIIDQRKDELHHNASQYVRDKLSFLNISDIFGPLQTNKRFTSEYQLATSAIYERQDIRTLMMDILR